ncbi:hypothetical protein [Phaeobacter sp.]|uniref:COG3904 family protein n=1 Tax=Phaeobacter sp. TaxID=1902409 RepID=UPI0025D120B9|nr:hypothetical protein [Phaeobacter sp.]
MRTEQPPQNTKRKSPETWRVLRWVFAAQLGFAAVLLGTDLAQGIPNFAWPTPQPGLDQPIRPGDQTRRYAPDWVPSVPTDPGSTPFPATGDFPDQLRFDMSDWDGQPVVKLTGRIAPGDSDRFREFITQTPSEFKTAFLHSPGGSVRDALAIGQLIRERAYNTEILANDLCLSACPYILAAGVERRADGSSLVGVHQHFFNQNTMMPAFFAVETIQRSQGEVIAYLDGMGVDPRLMQHALVTPADEIYVLSPEQLIQYELLSADDDS